MNTYESEIKTILQSQEAAFEMLSNFSNLEKIQKMDFEGSEKAGSFTKDLEFDNDSVHFSLPTIGRVGFRIVEREPFKTIKMEALNSPVSAFGWIQLVPLTDNECKMKLTIKAELPMMIKMMVDGKLKKGVDTIADVIARALNGKKDTEG